MKSDAYTITVDVDYDTTEYEGRVHENHSPDVVRWGLLLGDALYNVRCALDYLAYALTILETKRDPPPRAKSIYFPIVTDPQHWLPKMRSQIPRVGGKVQDAIETMQPYHGGDDPTIRNRVGEHPLELLATLNNADKHSILPVLVVVMAQASVYAWHPPIDAEFDADRIGDLMWKTDRALKEDAVIVRGAFKVTGPNPKVNMGADVTPGVQVEYMRRANKQWTIDFRVGGLDRIFTFVEEEVFGRIR